MSSWDPLLTFLSSEKPRPGRLTAFLCSTDRWPYHGASDWCFIDPSGSCYSAEGAIDDSSGAHEAGWIRRLSSEHRLYWFGGGYSCYDGQKDLFSSTLTSPSYNVEDIIGRIQLGALRKWIELVRRGRVDKVVSTQVWSAVEI